jgi:UDP-N-acetylmuramoyl-tripeptide--D-alanyl-D-alanine ligase
MTSILKKLLKKCSSAIIWNYQPEIIAITGSVGKTSAKDAIFAVLSKKGESSLSEKERWRVRKSKGNFNNEIGTPLNIIGEWSDGDLQLISRETPAGTKRIQKIFFWMRVFVKAVGSIMVHRAKRYPQVLVLEYGADRQGDIKYLLGMARPKIGVVTAIGETPSHLEYYPDAEAVAREKGRLIESLPAGGWAILNYDDELVLGMQEKTRARVKTFGFGEGADVRISQFENQSVDGRPEGIAFKIEHEGSFVPVTVKSVFGRAQAYSIAIAFAVGLTFGLNLVEIAELIERYYVPAKRRMNLIEGIKGSWIIDDSYNAAPLSVKEALSTVHDLEAGRKIAVLGDMLELGRLSIEAHESIGKMIPGIIDVLFVVGPRGKFIADSAIKSGMDRKNVHIFDTVGEMQPEVQNIVQKGDLVLVKASRGMGLDKVVDEIREMV